MQKHELIRAVNQIKLDPKDYQNMYEALKSKEGSTQKKGIIKYTKMMKYAAAVLVMGLAGAAISIPVKAIVESYEKERMESLSDDFLAEEMERINTQEEEASKTSREYSASEKERMEQLYSQYRQEGLFPKQQLLRVAKESEAEGAELFYVYSDRCFHLPVRELTDEELLEIIDYEVMENYVVAKNYEDAYQEEIAAQKAAQQQAIEEVKEKGGISKGAAVELATEKVQDIYGISLRDYEQLVYYASVSEDPVPRDSYVITWSNQIAHKFYYFYVDAYSGELYTIMLGDGDTLDLPHFTEDTFAALYPDMVAQSESFLKEYFALEGDYQATGYYAMDEMYGTIVLVNEKEADGGAYIFQFTSDGGMEEYAHKAAKEYQDYQETLAHKKVLNP